MATRNPKFASIGLVEIGEELASARKTKTQAKVQGLIGRFFHTFEEDGVVKWQGRIIGEPSEGIYLVETYDWMSGCDTKEFLVPLVDMMKWHFYESDDDMRFAYEHRGM